MRCYDFVLASLYRYLWLITFEIFRNFFLDRGVGGWGVSYPNLFWIFIFFYIFKAPNHCLFTFTDGAEGHQCHVPGPARLAGEERTGTRTERWLQGMHGLVYRYVVKLSWAHYLAS